MYRHAAADMNGLCDLPQGAAFMFALASAFMFVVTRLRGVEPAARRRAVKLKLERAGR